MNQFQRKSLYAALAGVGALGVTGAADAVNVNPNGLGQALIYPYYTVNTQPAGTYNSLLSVVNTTASAKAVKVRFLEGKNSREVLDFNLFLSKHDVWTAAVLPSSSGGGKVLTADNSCTIPDNSLLKAGADFVNFAYTGSSDDKGGSGLDRTKEGYVEIIEMATFPTYSCTSIQVTHVGGVPFDCAGLTDAGAAFDQFSASGGLFGGMTLINVGAGTDFTEDAVALQRFAPVRLYFPANDIHPQLQDVTPKVSVVYAAEPNGNLFDIGVYLSLWNTGTLQGGAADPVSAVLMHDSVNNEFVLDPGTVSKTDWVVTFPTKRFYVNVGTGSAPRLFQRNFNGTAGSCDDVTLTIYDREEKSTSNPVTFSPPPPTLTNSICWEANVVTFNNSNLLASNNTSNINTGFQNGWLHLGFATSTASTFHTLGNQTGTTHIGGFSVFSTGLTKTYLGLPVVGFAVQSFSNGTLTVGGVLTAENYGGNFVHKTTTTIVC